MKMLDIDDDDVNNKQQCPVVDHGESFIAEVAQQSQYVRSLVDELKSRSDVARLRDNIKSLHDNSASSLLGDYEQRALILR